MLRGSYHGWLGWRNLGDEAMFEVCRRQLPRVHWSGASLDAPPARRGLPRVRARWRRGGGGATVALLGGGTIVNRTPLWLDRYRELRRTARRPVPLFSPGVADPAFWSRFEGWRDTRAGWCAALADLPEIGVRGPHSKRLLEEAGLRNVTVTGDPALSLRRPAGALPPPGRRAVAINVGRANGLMWGSEERTLAAMADAAARLAAARFSVRVFPVWADDEDACRSVARAARLPDDAVDPLILDPDAFLEYLGGFDVVLSIKLHAAVLSAAAGVPFVAVEYQPKVRDFVDSVGWGRFAFRSDTVVSTQLECAVRALHDDLAAARAALEARVAELAQEFSAYAGRIEELLLAP